MQKTVKMPVFSKVTDFFNRHRNKFVVGGVILGGTIFLSRYAQRKLGEWQKAETVEFLEKNRKRQHFESIIRTCNNTAVSMSKTLDAKIAKLVNTDEIIAELKENPENKYELWNELKFTIFIKTTCTIYCKVLLVTMLRIQLSLVGGYLYKNADALSEVEQAEYLALCENVIHSGLHRMQRLAEKVCRKVLEPLELNMPMKLSDIETILWSIQTGIGSDADNPIDKMQDYMIPEVPSRTRATGNYGDMIRDTADILRSDEVRNIAQHCVTRSFMLLGEKVSEYYTDEDLVQNGTTSKDFSNPFNGKKPMAKVLPILNGIFSKRPAADDPFLQFLVASEKLQVLSANIYESVL